MWGQVGEVFMDVHARGERPRGDGVLDEGERSIRVGPAEEITVAEPGKVGASPCSVVTRFGV